MYYNIETVTPDMARALLQRGGRNRRLNKNRVAIYANDIRNGRWTKSPQPICVGEDGTLKDGQHRLNAIILADTPVQCTIAYDVPADAVMDKGLERSTGDALYMRGVLDKEMSNPKAIALANRYMELLGKTASSDSEKAEFILEHKDSISKALRIVSTGSKSGLCNKAPVSAAVAAALEAGISEDVLLRFAEVVNTGFMASPNESAAIVLRNYMLETQMYGSSTSNRICGVAQMSIRDFADGIPRKQKYRKIVHTYIRRPA